MPQALGVWLRSRRIGTFTNLAGDDNLFSFEPEYVEDDARPVLSQAFIGGGGTLVRRVPRAHRVAPPFFANLLPEDGSILRAMIARQHRINRTRDFPYLHVLGRDLPGAVVMEELDGRDAGEPTLEDTLPPTERPLRFSLAGVQLKFSASVAAGRVTIPVGGTGGSWIAKLPTNAFPRLPENEAAMMRFARAIGLDVPRTDVVDLGAIDGLPDDLPALRDDEPRKAYVVERFDRLPDGDRVHVEDFNQVAAQSPEEKYDNKTSSWVAGVIAALCPQSDVTEFVRRLVFGICIGNNDMHLKNWAITYPDGVNARLAPMYDYVCTRAYYPAGQLALTVGGERRFEHIGHDAIVAFAKSAEIASRPAQRAAREVVDALRQTWPAFRQTIDDRTVIEALDRQFATVPLMRE